MIDKNRIFQLFGSPENSEEGMREIINAKKDFLKSPTAKLGMFTKMIYNHDVFHQKLKKFFDKEKIPLNVNETKEASSFTVFNRAWSYIEKINLEDKATFEAVWEFKSEPLLKALNQAIAYFESTEQYERCAKLLEIKKLKETLEDSLDI